MQQLWFVPYFSLLGQNSTRITALIGSILMSVHKDRALVKAAFSNKNGGWDIGYVSENLKNDRKIVAFAVENTVPEKRQEIVNFISKEPREKLAVMKFKLN